MLNSYVVQPRYAASITRCVQSQSTHTLTCLLFFKLHSVAHSCCFLWHRNLGRKTWGPLQRVSSHTVRDLHYALCFKHVSDILSALSRPRTESCPRGPETCWHSGMALWDFLVSQPRSQRCARMCIRARCVCVYLRHQGETCTLNF